MVAAHAWQSVAPQSRADSRYRRLDGAATPTRRSAKPRACEPAAVLRPAPVATRPRLRPLPPPARAARTPPRLLRRQRPLLEVEADRSVAVAAVGELLRPAAGEAPVVDARRARRAGRAPRRAQQAPRRAVQTRAISARARPAARARGRRRRAPPPAQLAPERAQRSRSSSRRPEPARTTAVAGTTRQGWPSSSSATRSRGSSFRRVRRGIAPAYATSSMTALPFCGLGLLGLRLGLASTTGAGSGASSRAETICSGADLRLDPGEDLLADVRVLAEERGRVLPALAEPLVAEGEVRARLLDDLPLDGRRRARCPPRRCPARR